MHSSVTTKYKAFVCLFMSDHYTVDEVDIDLQHSLANLIAPVLGSPPHSNHLWYHMFAADKLHNTFMTGFMVSCVYISLY